MIRVEGLTKFYGSHRGIEDVSFQVKKGEILGFLGPNAAGKTTTMRILAGYMPPTRGKAEVAGYEVVRNPLEVKRRVGYMPENPPLYHDMTVRSFLEFVGRIKGLGKKKCKEEVEKVSSWTGLEEVEGRLIQNISRGYRQRVGLAQALIGEPEILIFDEPTIGLDPRQIIEIRNLIKKLGKEKTVLLSSHILPEVQQVCQRVVIINEGKVVAEDTPEGLSRKLSGSERLRVQVKGPPEEVEKRLREIEGILEVRRDDGGWVVEAKLEKDIRENIFFKLAEAKLPLLELKKDEISLEEVFLKLTTKEFREEEK